MELKSKGGNKYPDNNHVMHRFCLEDSIMALFLVSYRVISSKFGKMKTRISRSILVFEKFMERERERGFGLVRYVRKIRGWRVFQQDKLTALTVQIFLPLGQRENVVTQGGRPVK